MVLSHHLCNPLENKRRLAYSNKQQMYIQWKIRFQIGQHVSVDQQAEGCCKTELASCRYLLFGQEVSCCGYSFCSWYDSLPSGPSNGPFFHAMLYKCPYLVTSLFIYSGATAYELGSATVSWSSWSSRGSHASTSVKNNSCLLSTELQWRTCTAALSWRCCTK